MNINKQEIENVSRLEPFKRYKYFIKKIADFEELWILVDENEEIALSMIDKKTLVTVWSAKEFADSCLNEKWENYVPFKLTLDQMEQAIFSHIEENSYLINVFPVNNKSGFVVNLHEFIRDLNEELEWYE